MASRGGLLVTGLTRVVSALKAIGSDVDDPADALDTIASEGADRAARHAPRKSGRLAGGIRPERTRRRAAVISTATHSGPINYGWPARNIPANPFMQRADDDMRDRSVELLEDGVARSIRKRGLS